MAVVVVVEYKKPRLLESKVGCTESPKKTFYGQKVTLAQHVQNLILIGVEGSRFFDLMPPKATKCKSRLDSFFHPGLKCRESNELYCNLAVFRNLILE